MLTSTHWMFMFWVLVIIVLMGLRQDPIIPCVLGVFFVSWVNSGSPITAITSIFNSMVIAGQEFWSIILVVAMIVALSELLNATGADYIIMSPFAKMMVNPSISFWVLGFSMLLFSWFFWPSPAVALIGAVMVPVAIRAGLPAMACAVAMNLFGHGTGLSSDFVLQGAPNITGKAAGFEGSYEVMMASIPLVIVMTLVTTVIAFFIMKKDMRENPEQIIKDQEAIGASEEVELDKYSYIIAILTPIAFIINIIMMFKFELRGDDATALLGATSLIILIIGSMLKYKLEGFEKITDFLKDGFTFGVRVFAPVIIIGGFFFMGKSDLSKLILNDPAAPGFLEDFGLALANAVPLNKVIVSISTVLTGMIVGLDGSGFSPLPLVGSVANTFSQSVALDKATLAALGQIAGVWTGGGTIIPWGVIPVAAVCNVSAMDLARKNFIPVIIGLIATTIVAILIM